MSFVRPDFSRLLSRILLLVMLATVFAPGFGWEALEGSTPHTEVVVVSLAAAETGDCHGHHQMAADGHQTTHEAPPAAGGEVSHHCCPGHVLGHLPAGVSTTLVLASPQGDRLTVDRAARAFSSRIPEGLERPPRVAA